MEWEQVLIPKAWTARIHKPVWDTLAGHQLMGDKKLPGVRLLRDILTLLNQWVKYTDMNEWLNIRMK